MTSLGSDTPPPCKKSEGRSLETAMGFVSVWHGRNRTVADLAAVQIVA